MMKSLTVASAALVLALLALSPLYLGGDTARGQADSDADGWSDSDENYLGTNPNDDCGPGAWPPDINGDTVVDTEDAQAFRDPLFEDVDAGNVRLDLHLEADVIDLLDVLELLPYFFQRCLP